MFNSNVVTPFLNSALKFKESNAFCINGTYYTYAQLIERIAAIAKELEGNKEVSIGLVTNDHLDTYASIFSIWLTGKMYVPLNPSSPGERNQNVIDQVGINTILDSNETKALNSDDFETSIDLLKSYSLKSEYDNQLAYVFFTSGSTGDPKGVMISKENVAKFMEAFWAIGYDINETDRCLQMFELTFDLSVVSYLSPLLRGACVYTIPTDKVKYGYIFELMDEKELTVALMVPSILNYLRPYFDEIKCPKMRYSLFCGEALHLQIIEEWANCLPNARIDNVYGPTENTIFCTSYSYKRDLANDSHNGVLSIGKSMLNNLTVVFNDENEPAKINEIGELCLAGAQLTSGYFNNDQLNKLSFFTPSYNGVNTRFYRTGDLCLLKEDGNISYVGRTDSQVKIQGFRIELSEVEFYVNKAIKGLSTLVAMAVKNQANNHEVAVVFEAVQFDVNPIKQYLSTVLPSYMLPTQYYFTQTFPLNVNGKIDRKAIAKLLNINL
jgi:D-alanine--poly(phosphoribitol) ligase subunit 1